MFSSRDVADGDKKLSLQNFQKGANYLNEIINLKCQNWSAWSRGPVMWSSFLNKTEKHILSQYFLKHKIKKNKSEFEELNFF